MTFHYPQVIFLPKFSWSINLFFLEENFFICRKLSCLWKICFTLEKLFDQGKFSWPWKSFLMKKNFLDCRKLSWSRKSFLTVKNYFNQGKFPRLWNSSMIKEYFFDCWKLFSLTAEKIIGLIFLKTNASCWSR